MSKNMALNEKILRVVFMGTPEFAVPPLRALASRPDLFNIVAVYTQPDRPSGRGQKLNKPAIKVAAEELGLSVYQPENINNPDEFKLLSGHMADVMVVVAYAQFLGNAILNIPRLGCVNIHSSLLPKYRGAAPIQYAIWNGEKETGVSTMRLVKKMDAGPVYLQSAIPIPDSMTAQELHDQLSELGAKLIVETLISIQKPDFKETVQDESKVTYAKLIKKEDGQIQWDKSGVEIINQIRALNPWPGTFTVSDRGILKIHRAKFHENTSGLPSELKAGSIHQMSGSLWVRCSNGWIELLVVQPEGRKPMSVADYLNGLKGAQKK